MSGVMSLIGRSKECDHPETVTTRNYGLLRTVCRRCGMVHIEALRPEPRLNGGEPDEEESQAAAACS